MPGVPPVGEDEAGFGFLNLPEAFQRPASSRVHVLPVPLEVSGVVAAAQKAGKPFQCRFEGSVMLLVLYQVEVVGEGAVDRFTEADQ